MCIVATMKKEKGKYQKSVETMMMGNHCHSHGHCHGIYILTTSNEEK
jgi:hypothetical protein